jgi:hypothetical protein
MGMKTVPDGWEPGQRVECSGPGWPILDGVFFLAFTTATFGLGDLDMGSLMVVPVLIMLLYGVSCGTGIYWAHQCNQAKGSRSKVRIISPETERLLKVMDKLESGPRRLPAGVPEKYKDFCNYLSGTLVRLESKTGKTAEVTFRKCTRFGVEVERKDGVVGTAKYKRIWKISRAETAPKAEPVATLPKPRPEPEPVPEPPPELPPKVSPSPPPPPEPAVEVEDEPDSSGAFVFNNVKVFWGMGIAEGVSDPYSARRRADRAARTRIAGLLERNLDVLIVEGDDDLGLKITRFKKAILKHSIIVDRWQDPEGTRLFSVAVLPIGECGLDQREANLLWNRSSRGQAEAR